MRAAFQRSRTEGGGPTVMKPGELASAEYPDGSTMTAAARKTLVLLLHAAAGAAGEDVEHCIAKAALRGTHESNDRIRRVLDELQRVLLRVRVKSPRGHDAVLVAPIISQRIEETADDARSMVWWRFSEAMRRVIAASDHYAELHRQTVLALESRYAVTLYEMGALLHRREDPVWRGTLEQLRERFGVPGGKLRRWADLRRFVLEPATAEIQQLASFDTPWREFRHAGAVIGVEFRFWPKDPNARAASLREIDSSRVGRKARRTGKAERVVDPALQVALDALRSGEAPPGRR
jgi:plasmid replication initiation protein